MARPQTSRWKLWLGISVAALLIAVVVGPYLYIHFIEGPAPAPLAFASTSATSASPSTAATSSTSPGGSTWSVATGSVVGYRVNEVLFGQNNVAVGRTSAVTGTLKASGKTVVSAEFTVDMTTVTSDQSRRDEQFNGRIMDTATYPTATFSLTQPIELPSVPTPGATQTVQATGNLTMHGVTKSVTFTIGVRRSGSVVQVVGSIPITFADWNIANPSFGPVTTEDHGILEFALNCSQ
jgi:polyisoprenoid-binding protein YceI